MVAYFITRHEGARTWARTRGIEANHLDHLEDPGMVNRGDLVFGILPLHMIAAITLRGARYFHLDMNVPAERRGHPASAEEMERLGARLIEYQVYQKGQWRPEDNASKALTASLT